MRTATSWFAELLYALKTLPRNPYLRHYLKKIARPQTLTRVVLGYVIGTITQIIFNWIIISSLLGIKTTLVFDGALQATYLQQQSLLFLLAALVIPFIITVLLVGERKKNRLTFVQLTPISPYQITIGNLSRFFLPLLLVMVLHLPITLICLLTGNVELTYVFIMSCDLLIAALFFSVIILLADLFLYYEFKTGSYISGGLIIWMFLFFNYLGNISPQLINSFLISPFQIMSRQGIQLLPLSVKFPYRSHAKFLSSMIVGILRD